jgi:hypothetical protein
LFGSYGTNVHALLFRCLRLAQCDNSNDVGTFPFLLFGPLFWATPLCDHRHPTIGHRVGVTGDTLKQEVWRPLPDASFLAFYFDIPLNYGVVTFKPIGESQTFELYLRSGDVYTMNGALQSLYKHGVGEAPNDATVALS